VSHHSDNEVAAEAAVFAALAEALAPVTPPQGVGERLRARVLAATSAPPEGTRTWRTSEEQGWSAPGEFVRLKFLRVDEPAGHQEVLIRLLPGVRIPSHSHRLEEEMVILEGECHLGEHLLRAGDVHVAPPGSWHPEITTRTGALLLLRCEYPFPAG